MKANRYSLNRSLGLAVLMIALVSLIGSGVVLASLNRLRTSTDARGRSNETIIAINRFRTAMLDEETGIRGYLLTGRAMSLAPFAEGRHARHVAIVRLRELVANDPTQRQPLSEAIMAARDWQANVSDPVLRNMQNPATQRDALVIERSGFGKSFFDRFRERLDAMEARERESLAIQRAIVVRANRNAILVLCLAALVTLLICIGVGLTLSFVVVRPLRTLAETMRRLVLRDTDVTVPSLRQQNEVGAMARAVEVFRNSLIELDRTSVLRVTADTLPAMVGYIDTERRVGFLNAEFARWFDLGVEDVAQTHGQPIERIFPGLVFPGQDAELNAALAGREVRFAHRLERPGLPARDLEGDYRPHRAPDGRVLGAVTLLTDVTDRKDIDRRLRHQAHDLKRSNEELEQFAYVASHDLKAPLRGIENLATWIEEDLGDTLTGDPRTNMDLLKSRVRRLESLLNDLLAYSRAGRDDSVIRTVDTRALVAELALLIAPPEGFSIEGAPDLPTIPAAQAALSQVLQNLIGNAVKHHPDPAHGHIWVNATRTGDLYEFRVSDDGTGIPEQFRERVFGMFQTLRPRDEVEGSGMGLAIVRKLVERQAGTVWLSERAGGGLVVHFTWPATA